MLKGFSVYGLFGEYDYDIELSNSNITFIHSLNGFGKSTIMRLIKNILKGRIDEVRDVCFERIDLRFDSDTTLIIENDADSLMIRIQRNEIGEPIDADELAKVLNVLYIPPERSIIFDGKDLIPALRIYVDELTECIRFAKNDNELKSIPREGRTEYTDSELEFWCRDMKAKLDFIKGAGIEPEMPSGYRFPPARFEIAERRQEYEDLAFSIEDYIDRYYDLAESVIVFVDIANDFFINKEIYINESGVLNIRLNSGAGLPSNKLSSGERQILTMFYLLLFKTKRGSLVIIDEPEISMHVAWQQSLGKTFMDVARLRDLHIIVATHSPQVIHDNWDLAVEMKVDNDR